MVGAVRIEYVHQDAAHMDQPQLFVVANFVKRGESAGEEKPVTRGTMCITVGFYKQIGPIRVIKPVVTSKNVIYHDGNSLTMISRPFVPALFRAWWPNGCELSGPENLPRSSTWHQSTFPPSSCWVA
jgi:hypothetical protein